MPRPPEKFVKLTSEPTTPAQALFEIVRRAGYAQTKVDFARLLKIDEGNVYHYLADPDAHYRLAMSSDLVHALCWALTKVTDLRVTVVLTPDTDMELHVFGQDRHGHDIDPPWRAETLFGQPFCAVKANEPYTVDFRVARPWRDQWEEEWDLAPDEGEPAHTELEA